MTLFKATNSHQLSIVIIPVIMVMLATLCVVLRFRARRLRNQTAMFDDWFCLFALLLTWVFQGVNMAAVFAGGAGLPIATVMAIDPNAITVYLKIIFANFTIWVVTVTIVQLSILFFYLRIFGVSRTFRLSCYTVVGLVGGFGLAGLFSEIFSCVPVNKSWDVTGTVQGHCVESKPYCASIGIIHVFFDLAIVILPMPMIWHLKTAHKNKLILSGLLCLGLVATVISFVKIVCIFDLTGIPQVDATDYLWLTILLQTIELPIGLICCCVPSLKPALDELSITFKSLTSRLLSYGQPSADYSLAVQPKSYGTPVFPASDNESRAQFARLGDGSSQSITDRNKVFGHETAIELADRKDAGNDGLGRDINVARSYAISYKERAGQDARFEGRDVCSLPQTGPLEESTHVRG